MALWVRDGFVIPLAVAIKPWGCVEASGGWDLCSVLGGGWGGRCQFWDMCLHAGWEQVYIVLHSHHLDARKDWGITKTQAHWGEERGNSQRQVVSGLVCDWFCISSSLSTSQKTGTHSARISVSIMTPTWECLFMGGRFTNEKGKPLLKIRSKGLKIPGWVGGGLMNFHHLLRTYWQLLMLRKGRASFLHRCKSWEAPGDDPIPVQIQTTLCAISDFYFFAHEVGRE